MPSLTVSTIKLIERIIAVGFNIGAVYTPSKFTLTGVYSAHGSHANASCPSACVRMVSGIRVCDCTAIATDTTGIALIDGIIPMFDVSQPNWAAQLYTATITKNNWVIDFQFPDSFMLRQVDLYLFFCPLRQIPHQDRLSIRVYQSVFFPTGFKGLFLGNNSLTMERQNCLNLTQISIPTIPISEFTQYVIEFAMEGVIGGIYIGECSFTGEITSVVSRFL